MFFKKKKDQGCINFSNSNLIVHGAMATPLRVGKKINMCMDIITLVCKVETVSSVYIHVAARKYHAKAKTPMTRWAPRGGGPSPKTPR